MDYSEYRVRALATAVYPKENGKLYTTIGLISELGEAGGKIKKLIRGDEGITPEMLHGEFGDILWYIATVTEEFGLTFTGKMGSFTSAKKVYDFEIMPVASTYTYLARLIFKFVDACMSNQLFFASMYLVQTLDIFETLCMVSGTRSLKVAQANLSKLESRKERDVLKGDGDER